MNSPRHSVDRQFQEQVALACRMIALEGYADLTLGHVSIRDPETDTVYIKRKGPGLHEIEPDDVLIHDLQDDAAIKTTPHMHYEAVLHTETYKRRRDVNAVVHSHPPYSTAFGSTEAEFQILSHDGVLFADGVAAYDETFWLITEPDQGADVAQSLGDRRALFLRGHGSLVVGEDIRWAVLACLTLERAIKIQMIAQRLGALRPIRKEAAEEFFPHKYADRHLDEYWAGWIRQVRNAGAQVPLQVGFD